MATTKGNGVPLTHQQMDANFNEVTQATTDIATLRADVTNNTAAIVAETTRATEAEQGNLATLQAQITALQAELDANQQSAENITTGVISRINTAKTQAQGYLNTYQSLPAFNTGDATLDGLLNDLVAQLITELQAMIVDYNAQITLLSEDFTI